MTTRTEYKNVDVLCDIIRARWRFPESGCEYVGDGYAGNGIEEGMSEFGGILKSELRLKNGVLYLDL